MNKSGNSPGGAVFVTGVANAGRHSGDVLCKLLSSRTPAVNDRGHRDVRPFGPSATARARLAKSAFAALMLLAAELSPGVAIAQSASCSVQPPEPTTLAKASAIESYRPVLQICADRAGAQRVATRAMRISSKDALLLVDAESLHTDLQAAACWTCRDIDEAAMPDSRFRRAVVQSAEAPGLTKRGFLENAGLIHGAGGGIYLTGDLCPSTKPLDRDFLERVAQSGPHAPIALSISGLWLTRHFADYRWILDQQADGAIDVVWVNHSYHHQFKRGVPFDHNFLLTPGVEADEEILETERLLIANGQIPSVFFRFPGLISSAPLMQAARRHHLVSLGADAWLALRQKPTEGSIVLVHPNGNEPAGLKIYAHDVAAGNLPQPLRPLVDAPP